MRALLTVSIVAILVVFVAIACSKECEAGGVVGIGGGGVVAAQADSGQTSEVYLVAGWLFGENDSYGVGARAITNGGQEIVDGAGWVLMKFAQREYIRLEVGHKRGRFTISPMIGASYPVTGKERFFVASEAALNVNGEPDLTITAGVVWKAWE